MENLPQNPNVKIVGTDTWDYVYKGQDIELSARVEPCVLVVIHSPYHGTFFGHFSVPEENVSNREMVILPQDLKAMVDYIQMGDKEGNFSIADAKVNIMGGSKSSVESEKYNNEVDRSFKHAVDSIKNIGFAEGNMHIVQSSPDTWLDFRINNLTGEVNATVIPLVD